MTGEKRYDTNGLINFLFYDMVISYLVGLRVIYMVISLGFES